MQSAIRKFLLLACGIAAAIALGVPASAQAATAAATTPALHASNCGNGVSPKNFQLWNRGTFDVGEIDPSDGFLYIGGGVAHDFCQALLSTGIVQIFTRSSDYCLAYSAAANNAYEHVPTGCTSASPPAYTQWKFIFIGQDGTSKYYELRTVYNGECLYGLPDSRTTLFGQCNSADNGDLFYTIAV
jgi:hypothetical protein